MANKKKRAKRKKTNMELIEDLTVQMAKRRAMQELAVIKANEKGLAEGEVINIPYTTISTTGTLGYGIPLVEEEKSDIEHTPKYPKRAKKKDPESVPLKAVKEYFWRTRGIEKDSIEWERLKETI